MINISAEEKNIVCGILGEHLPGQKVMAFGSRVIGGAKKYSDLDLVILGERTVGFEVMVWLKDAFAESDLPYRVDVIEWCRTSDEFKAVIEGQLEELCC